MKGIKMTMKTITTSIKMDILFLVVITGRIRNSIRQEFADSSNFINKTTMATIGFSIVKNQIATVKSPISTVKNPISTVKNPSM